MLKKLVCCIAALLAGVAAVEAQSLKGSKASMRKQFDEAKENDLTRLKNPAMVEKFEDLGLLVELKGSDSYEVAKGVRYPVARPMTKLFVERLSRQYMAGCGEAMVVTSLTRPLNKQPRNASKLSVHPAGMSVDFRVPGNKRCASWLTRTLLVMEKAGVIEATREHHPPHYHVAVFPDNYRKYLDAKKKAKAKPKASLVKRAVRKR